MRILILPLLLFCSLAFSEDKQNYWDDRERGWYWYEKDKPVEEELKEKPIATPSAPPTLSPREQLKKQGEEWENSLATAILTRTPESYQEYLAMTTKIQQQSQEFATGLKQTVWVNPEYDYTLTKPVTTQAIVAKNQEDKAQQEQILSGMAQQNGLIFFFRSDCQFCHRFAPVLKKFAEHYGFTVVPVSLDGGGLPEFPYPKKNYDLGRKLKVDVVPALFIVQPDSNSIAAVGYGYSDLSTLIQKLLFAGQQLARR